MSDSGFRELYGPEGPQGYYRAHAAEYRNPHEPAVVAAIDHVVRYWSLPGRSDGIDLRRVLDLAAGSGEVTLALLERMPTAEVEACDPYTAQLYESRTGRTCQEHRFEDIATGKVVLAPQGCIISSCALHLAGDSWLAPLCLALAAVARDLLVITPLTRPEIRSQWGWTLMEATVCSVDQRGVRLRWYRSTALYVH